MADIDSKLRGEKEAGYCSDSDEEDGCKVKPATDENLNTGLPPMANTGPKGVLEDYKLYKQLKRIEKEENDKKTIELFKQIAFTADPNKHPDKDEEFEDDDDDEFLKRYHEKRLAQMKEEIEMKQNKRFDKLFEYSGEELVEAIEEQDKTNKLMIVHIYDSISPCIQMNNCLEQLVRDYPYIKFCKVLATNAGLSLHFKMNALPTIQVYQGGKLIGNYLRIHDQLDKEFYPGDVENFLLDAGVLESPKGCVSSVA